MFENRSSWFCMLVSSQSPDKKVNLSVHACYWTLSLTSSNWLWSQVRSNLHNGWKHVVFWDLFTSVGLNGFLYLDFTWASTVLLTLYSVIDGVNMLHQVLHQIFYTWGKALICCSSKRNVHVPAAVLVLLAGSKSYITRDKTPKKDF